jgi:hypothetical protein
MITLSWHILSSQGSYAKPLTLWSRRQARELASAMLIPTCCAAVGAATALHVECHGFRGRIGGTLRDSAG